MASNLRDLGAIYMSKRCIVIVSMAGMLTPSPYYNSAHVDYFSGGVLSTATSARATSSTGRALLDLLLSE
jgi:hypothetical protein